MKNILFLFALLPVLAFGQKSTSLSKNAGDVQPSDTNTYLATKYELASAVGITYPDAGIPLSTGAAWGTSITNNSTNWNTAYTDRLKWNGGATGLTAATGRTSLGATKTGSAFFTLATPASITFPRINADSTITVQSAADFKTSLSLQNVTNESKATMFTSPTFTGTMTTPDSFYIEAVRVLTNGTELNVLDGIPGTLTSTELGYVDGVTSAIQTQIAGLTHDSTWVSANITTLVSDSINADTIATGVLLATGVISGAVSVTLDTDPTVILTAAMCKNRVRINNDADVIDYTLPGAAAGLIVLFYDVAGGVITIDAASGDEILLNGVSVGVADAIDSPGDVGNFICLMAIDATRWITLGQSGTWIDSGAD